MEYDHDSAMDYFQAQNDHLFFLKDKNKKSDPQQQYTKFQHLSMLKSPQKINQLQILNNNQTNYSYEYGERQNFSQILEPILPKEQKNGFFKCKNKKNKDVNQFNKNEQKYQTEDEKNKINIISSSSFIEISANTETDDQVNNYNKIQKNVQDYDINYYKKQNMTNDCLVLKNQQQQKTYEDTENDSNEQIIVVKNKSVNINIEIEPVHAQQKIDNNWFTRIIQEKALIMMNSINHLRQMPNKILWESWRQVELEQYWHYFNGVRYHCISKRGFHKSLSKQPDAIVLKENSGSLHYFRQNQQLIPACSICHHIGEYYLRKVQYYRLFVSALKNFKKKSLFRKEILLEMLLEFLTDKKTLQNQIFFLQKPKFLDKIEQMKIKQKEQEESLKQMKQQKLIEKCGNENIQNEQDNQENDDDNSYLEIELEQKKAQDYNIQNSPNNQKVQEYQKIPSTNQNQNVNIDINGDNFVINDHQFQFENEIKKDKDKQEQVYISSQDQLKQLLEQQKNQSKNKKTIKLSQKLLKQLLKMQQENDNQDSDLEQSSEKLYTQNYKKDHNKKSNEKLKFQGVLQQQKQQQQIKQPTINLQQKNANLKINQDENHKFEFQNKEHQSEQGISEEMKDGLEYNWQSNLNKLKQIYINPKKYNQLSQKPISQDQSMGSHQNINLNTQNQNKIKEDTQQIIFTNNHNNKNNAQKNMQKKQKFQYKE